MGNDKQYKKKTAERMQKEYTKNAEKIKQSLRAFIAHKKTILQSLDETKKEMEEYLEQIKEKKHITTHQKFLNSLPYKED